MQRERYRHKRISYNGDVKRVRGFLVEVWEYGPLLKGEEARGFDVEVVEHLEGLEGGLCDYNCDTYGV